MSNGDTDDAVRFSLEQEVSVFRPKSADSSRKSLGLHEIFRSRGGCVSVPSSTELVYGSENCGRHGSEDSRPRRASEAGGRGRRLARGPPDG